MNYVWEQRKVGDYLTESREIGNKGDVARKMTVKLWGKGVYEKLEAGSTNTQYFIRHANQFIYSKLDFLNCAFGVVPEELESLETTADVPAFDCVYMNPYFMFYRTIQPSFYIQNGIIANGSRKAKRIHTDTFLEMPISVPCLTEQNKIVGYFQSLDHLITLHQRKIYIFIKKMPIDWEQRKLGDVLSLLKDGTHGTHRDAESGPLLLSAKNIKNGTVQWDESDRRISEDEYNIIHSNFRLQKGDVLLTIVGSIGEVAILSQSEGVTFQRSVAFLRPSDEICSEFLYSEIQGQKFQKELNDRKSTSAQPGMYLGDLGAIPIEFPTSDEEQMQIGSYFSTIDHLITLHHRKCIILRKMKVNDWEQRKLGEVLKERTKRAQGGEELLSVTIANGVIRQADSEKRNIASEDKSNYKIVRKGDIPYNSMRMWQGAVGNSEYDGIVSPAYTVLVPTDEANAKFFMEYFKKENSLQLFQRWSQGLTSDTWNLKYPTLSSMRFSMPSIEEQNRIASYFEQLDHLITLHHRKRVILKKTKVSDWEQRKFSELYKKVNEKNIFRFGVDKIISVANMYFKEDVKKPNDEYMRTYNIMRLGDIAFEGNKSKNFSHGRFVENTIGDGIVSHVFDVFRPVMDYDLLFWKYLINNENVMGRIMTRCTKASTMMTNLVAKDFLNENILVPTIEEQHKIGTYIDKLDHLITLHHHEEFCTENVLIYIEINKTIQIKEDIMAELESVIEQKLIDQLVYGDSQWTYRADLKTEEDLWNNFRYILVQNNKDRLNGEPLSDTEFEQVKNQLQFSSFYKAGEWLVGENGKVMVHVQRDTERLHLVVMNHEHIAGGSSVYEVINQYRALADEESQTKAQDRRFDVTLMINGLPMIHIELKNKQHSYMDGFWQIKKYIGEGKFTGIFSAVQMFVISNGVDTKYFSAASDTELNSKFISGWLDNENNPVPDYLDFAKSVLRIPEAHEMIARYTVLDEEAKRLILLRPYQIHAIEAIREASKTGKSGFVWHTTGSGKTLTSYKATRNLLMDIPSIDKAIFLIDRKDLDTQTSMAFRTYANNDLVDVDQTDNVFDLKKKLKSDDRQMIVTTIQKLQRLITKKLAEGTPEYNKIKSLKIAFVVDECHRAVTPGTKRELERFFANSLWYGFTGTPRFAENPYPQLGDLPRTTEELYGERLHRYTIQNAIHDNAVLGFQVEHNGPKNMDDETDSSMYENETHMLRVLDVILNKSYHKLGFQNGKGKTYEGLLTTSSIQLAQKYYELLKRVKNGETELQIDEKVKQILPDFPKFAITYSVTENEEGSHLNQEKMKESINDYNEMFGTKLDISQIQSYNANLNKRLARKEPKFQSRSEQLDLVIVVDRLLTGFDAPCMSTLFVDRQPMGPHDLIQAFSRTNRIFDKNKTYGQIVTFQAPKLFKECVDNAVKLYSAGSTEIALLAEWEEIEPAFRKALKALRVSAETPAEIPVMSEKEKVLFVKAFQHFDKLFAQLKSFTQYEDSMLTEYGISEDEYDDYAGHYLNVKEELKAGAEDTQSEMEEQPIDVDYELMAYSNTKIDYEYIINLIQNIVTPDEDVEITPEERQKQLEEVKQYIDDLRKENPKVADIMSTLVSEIEQDEVKYKGQSILNIVENMKHECIEKVVMDFSITWYVSKDDVMYAATHYRNGEIPNESAIKSTADFTSFKEAQERAIPKFKYYNMMIEELRKTLEEEIKPLLNN